MYYDFDYVSILKVLSIKKDWFTIRYDRKPAFIFIIMIMMTEAVFL